MATRPPIAADEIPPPLVLSAGADALGELADDDDATVGTWVGTVLVVAAEVILLGIAELEIWLAGLLADSDDEAA